MPPKQPKPEPAPPVIYYWEIDWWRSKNDYLGENTKLLVKDVYTPLNLSVKDNFFNDTTIDNAINAGLVSPQIYEIRRRLFDNSEGFKLWRELGMSISNTIKSVLNGVVWTRSIIEQGRNLGYASIEAQCRDGMKDYREKEKTCEYCGYTEDIKFVPDPKDETRKGVIFSCEHVLEVGLLWMFLGISFTAKSGIHAEQVKNLYQFNYRMACCRCNFIKADIQVNKSIVPDSPSGEPTIFVGWNPVKKRFYVNMLAVQEFAKLVMCFSMRTTGAAGKGHKHILDHLSRTSTSVADGIAKIAKRTAACVKSCVDHMNKMIFETPKENEAISVKKAFNPSIVRFAGYKTVYDFKIPKADVVNGGGKGKLPDNKYVAWLSRKVDELMSIIGSAVNNRMFDNSILTVSDTTVDDQRRNKVRFMFLLNELLERSIEFDVYTNIANIYSLYNSSKFNVNGNVADYTRNNTDLMLVNDQLMTKYKSIVLRDVDDTTSYVEVACMKDTPIIRELEKYIRHNVQNLSSVLGSIGSNLASDDKLSLYIDIWNILNEHITRTHKIFLELIKIEKDTDFHSYIEEGQSSDMIDKFKKLLKVVRFCIGKGLCIILDNINRHCPDLVEYNRFSDNEFNFLFYELDSLNTASSSNTDFASYSTAILTANQHIKPIFGIYINSKGILKGTDQEFPILISELPTTVSNVKAITKQVIWNTNPYIPPNRSGTRDGTFIDGTQAINNEDFVQAINDATNAEKSDGENVVNKYNSDLQNMLVRKLEESRKSRGWFNQFINRNGGGSNFEIKLISGIGSMLRNEVTNKSKYNISTKRPKMNKKTRKNVFSLLEKRRKQTIANKHRKNKTLRKK